MIKKAVRTQRPAPRKISGYVYIFIFTVLITSGINMHHAWAACSCETGTRGSFIGMEMTAKECPTQDADDTTVYTYIDQAIQCRGDKIGLFANWGDTVGTPGSISNFHATNGMRVLRNEKGTHILAVHAKFDGKIYGLSMSNYAPGNITTLSAMDTLCVGDSNSFIDNDGDGVSACQDCNDKNVEVGAGTEDNDGDGVPACVDCDDETKDYKAGKGIDRDEDGIDACQDCNEQEKNLLVTPCSTCPVVGYPVNYFTGTMTHDLNLINLPGAPVSLPFTLQYDSHKQDDQPLGIGWSHNQAVYLSISEDLVMVSDRSLRPPSFATYDEGNTWRISWG